MTIQTWREDLPHGITLTGRAAGRTDQPVLLFLHGFPEAAFVWDDTLLALADRFRCVAPNLRGYADSSAPQDVSDYRMRALMQDMTALIERLGGRVRGVVAHDWGGAVGWSLGIQRPDLLERLVILNSPHPYTFARDLAHDPAQQAASAYMNWLRQSGSEDRLARDRHALLWKLFTGMAATPWLTDALRGQYDAVWRQGLRGPVNYYRASPLFPPTDQEAGARAVAVSMADTTVTVRTLVLWGTQDQALLPCLLDGLDACLPQGRIERWADASHWLVHEHPQRVAQALGQFFAEAAS